MNENLPLNLLDQEPERYELREPPRYSFGPDRRDFLKIAGGGLAVFLLSGPARAQQRGKGRGRGGRGGGGAPQVMGAWLHIAEDGQITLYSGKTEVGQNVRTSVTQALAEELRVSPAAISVVLANTDLCPNEGGTSGSRSTPATIPQVRRVGAAAREMLLDLAAEQLKVPRGELSAADAKVTHGTSNRSLKYGELTKGQKLTKTVSGDAPLTPTKDWKVLGTSTAKVGGREIVTGGHKYASDIQLPGMLHGKFISLSRGQNPASIASLLPKGSDRVRVSLDATDGFVSILAPSAYEADLVASDLREKIRKSASDAPSERSHKTLFADLKRGARVEPSPGVEAALKAADHKLENTYTIAYIAHAPLEPRAAVAEWKDSKVTVWTGTQQPFRIRDMLMQAFGVPADKVRVIVPDTGSGYGGKHTVDTAVEAARLAKAAGKPVKVVWTREEEFNYAYFRPAGVIDVRAGATQDGLVTAWDFHNYNSGQSAVRGLYDVPQRREQFHNSSAAPLKQGSYRALASTANTFAREAAMDELAHKVNMDPLAFRLKNLKDERLRAVFEAAAEKFGWGKTEKAANHGCGIAGGSEKGSFVASCAEVVRDPATGKIRVTRVVTAYECGTILNPDKVTNQIEGAVIQGLGGALFEEIQFEGTKVLNAAFSSYRVPRFADTPVLETVLVNRPDLAPIGAGETPIIAVAPAVAQAAFEATGIRARSLPLSASGIKS